MGDPSTEAVPERRSSPSEEQAGSRRRASLAGPVGPIEARGDDALAPLRARAARARSGRRGTLRRAGRALLPAAAAVLALGLAALLHLATRAPREGSGAVSPRHHALSPSAQGGHLAQREGSSSVPAHELAGRSSPGLDTGAPLVEARHRFGGQGSIRGEIVVPAGLALPRAYTVIAEPSRVLLGREHAARREQSFEAGEPRFELRGLPLGGYDLRVRAEGMNCDPMPVLLCEGAEHPYLVIALHPTGFLDGSVLDEAGTPVEELLVTLEPLAAELPRRQTRTTPSGTYLFEDLPDGEYRIHFGPPHAPLAPSSELSFRAPSMSFPQRRIPVLLTLELRTLDENGFALPGAHVSGYGPAGGQIELVTDEEGRGLARFLPPGRYQIAARHEGTLRASTGFELQAGEPAELVLRLRQ